MGQLQRDDRRGVRQETVELWGIERGRTGAPRSGKRRPVRQLQQIGESRREREYPPSDRLRQERGRQQAGRPRQSQGYQQSGQTRQARKSGQNREIQQIGLARTTGKSRQRSQNRQERIEGFEQRRFRQKEAVSYQQPEELQFVLPVDYPQAGNPRPVRSIKRRRARRRKIILSRVVVFAFVLLCLVLIYQATGAVYRYLHQDVMSNTTAKKEGFIDVLSDKMNRRKIAPPEIIEDYLDINGYSRPGTALNKIDSVFVHYTANPGTSAQQNRSYFANLAQTHERSASAHFIIGYEGELIQCIPLDEQAYAVATRNGDSVSIECCYLAEDGSFTPETYETLLHTLAWLLEEYNLTTDDILRHYDCGGKKCPLYYVEHEDAWEQLLSDVEAYEMPEKQKE